MKVGAREISRAPFPAFTCDHLLLTFILNTPSPTMKRKPPGSGALGTSKSSKRSRKGKAKEEDIDNHWPEYFKSVWPTFDNAPFRD